MKVIVGNAWPYANGQLHIGRIGSWIPGDVIARYHRIKGDEVIFVSGSDCHGELVLKKAMLLDRSPKFISDYYHEKFRKNFEDLDFSFDNFAKTSDEYHKDEVENFIKILDKNKLIYSKNVEIYFCGKCNQEVGDKFIDNNKHIECGVTVSKKAVDKLFFKLSTFEKYLESLVTSNLNWRENAKKITQRYLDEGIRDRVLSRDIDWGIDIPIDKFKDKKVFVWIEAVMGYITASKKVINDRNLEVEEFWNDKDSRVYLLHGKENIPFHTILMTSIVAGIGYENCNFRILSSERMNLEGKQFSSNRNWVVWLDYMIKNYDKDSIRYYLLKIYANDKASNFTWRDFINTHNLELVGGYGNFIYRTASFVQKYYNGKLEKQRINNNIKRLIEETYDSNVKNIELGNMNLVIEDTFKLVSQANEYFEREKPWIAFKNDPLRCKEVIYNCLVLALNIANILEPIIPHTSAKIKKFLKSDISTFEFIALDEFNVFCSKFLFEKIDRKKVIEEINSLKKNRR